MPRLVRHGVSAPTVSQGSARAQWSATFRLGSRSRCSASESGSLLSRSCLWSADSQLTTKPISSHYV
eukprot:5382145-Heterocapsa_arctica.AAC.1